MELLTKYIEECLQNARYFKKSYMINTFYMQAFGAVNLFCRQTWDTNPEAEAKALALWSDHYRPQFEAELWAAQRGE